MSSSITPVAQIAIQTAFEGAQSALSAYSELIFAFPGQYTNSGVLGAASSSVYAHLVEVGLDAAQINLLKGNSSLTAYNGMCTGLSDLLVSVYTYSEAISSRDTHNLVRDGLRDFMDGAWSMLELFNSSATVCEMRKNLQTGADAVQNAFLSFAQYETLSEYYPDIIFGCTDTGGGTGQRTNSNTNTGSSSKVFLGPTSESWTGSVFITTFHASTSDSINKAPLVAAGILSGLFCVLV